MTEIERANQRLSDLLGRLGGWLPQDGMAEVAALWRDGDPAATFACLCRWLNADGVILSRRHYQAVASLGAALMVPSRMWDRVPVYLPEE